jgi:DNA invertase Pin-like site-specific DNA recombinase
MSNSTPTCWRDTLVQTPECPANGPKTICTRSPILGARGPLVACKKHRARLVIAKLDRLSRDLAFIATLMERKVDFIAVDNPTATKFTIDILAAVAEHERDAISARSKAALAAAKAKGKQLGNYQRIAVAKQQATAERAEAVRPAIAETAHLAARAAAAELNRRSIRTASGKPWHAMQIIRPCDRLGL